MPAQVVTPLETMESREEETQLLAWNRLVISLRLCRTAKLDLASAWNSQRSVNPVYNSTNVLDSMCAGTWNIPKNREEAPSLRSLMGNVLTKLPTCSIECDQLRIPYPNHCSGRPGRCWIAPVPIFGDLPLLPLQQTRWQAC